MVFCVVNRSCGETRGSSCSRRRKASIFSLGQSERLAKVRWRVFLPSRQPSRRRMAGGELRLGTTAIYMRTLTNINPNLSREIYSYMRTQINENQVAVRAKPHIFKILTSNRASTVGWNFGLKSLLLGERPRQLGRSPCPRSFHLALGRKRRWSKRGRATRKEAVSLKIPPSLDISQRPLCRRCSPVIVRNQLARTLTSNLDISANGSCI